MPAYVYILSNKRRTTLYIGVTINIHNRMMQHTTSELKKSFSKRYNTTELVYLEEHHSLEEARARELQLKKWSRAAKEKLIAGSNPNWLDLSNTLIS